MTAPQEVNYTTQMLALICAANARIEGMKAANAQRAAIGQSMAFMQHDFLREADELERLAQALMP